MAYLRRLRLKKGMTLVETMLSLVILSVLVMISAGIIMTVGNIFTRNAVLSDSRMLAARLSKYLGDRLMCSCTVTLANNDEAIKSSSAKHKESIVITAGGTQMLLIKYGADATSTEVEKLCTPDDLGSRRIRVTFNTDDVSKGYIKAEFALCESDIKEQALFSKEIVIPMLNKAVPKTDILANSGSDDLYITYTYNE